MRLTNPRPKSVPVCTGTVTAIFALDGKRQMTAELAILNEALGFKKLNEFTSRDLWHSTHLCQSKAYLFHMHNLLFLRYGQSMLLQRYDMLLNSLSDIATRVFDRFPVAETTRQTGAIREITFIVWLFFDHYFKCIEFHISLDLDLISFSFLFYPFFLRIQARNQRGEKRVMAYSRTFSERRVKRVGAFVQDNFNFSLARPKTASRRDVQRFSANIEQSTSNVERPIIKEEFTANYPASFRGYAVAGTNLHESEDWRAKTLNRSSQRSPGFRWLVCSLIRRFPPKTRLDRENGVPMVTHL